MIISRRYYDSIIIYVLSQYYSSRNNHNYCMYFKGDRPSLRLLSSMFVSIRIRQYMSAYTGMNFNIYLCYQVCTIDLLQLTNPDEDFLIYKFGCYDSSNVEDSSSQCEMSQRRRTASAGATRKLDNFLQMHLTNWQTVIIVVLYIITVFEDLSLLLRY